MKIAILGAGSLGTIIGGLITKDNYDVDLIDKNISKVSFIKQRGVLLKGHLDLDIRVSAKHTDELSEKYDIVFLLTKQNFSKEALTSLLPFLYKESVVCTLQNGIPEEFVASIVGKGRTVSGAVGFGATEEGLGVSRLTTEIQTLQKHAFDIGELDGITTNRINTIKQILDCVGKCNITNDIRGVKWAKLLMNTTFGGMSAILGCTYEKILENRYAMVGVANLADETIKVAHAKHIKLASIQGRNFEYLELNNQKDIQNKLGFYNEVWKPHSKLKASMLQDLEKGVITEINHINGHVIEEGKKFGIPTPFNKFVYQIVQDAQNKQIVPFFHDNIVKVQNFITEIND